VLGADSRLWPSIGPLLTRASFESVGKNAAKSALEKLDFSDMSARTAVTEVAKILYAGHDPSKEKPIELELSWVCDESKRMHALVPPELFDEAVAAGKAHREAMDDD